MRLSLALDLPKNGTERAAEIEPTNPPLKYSGSQFDCGWGPEVGPFKWKLLRQLLHGSDVVRCSLLLWVFWMSAMIKKLKDPFCTNFTPGFHAPRGTSSKYAVHDALRSGLFIAVITCPAVIKSAVYFTCSLSLTACYRTLKISHMKSFTCSSHSGINWSKIQLPTLPTFQKNFFHLSREPSFHGFPVTQW